MPPATYRDLYRLARQGLFAAEICATLGITMDQYRALWPGKATPEQLAARVRLPRVKTNRKGAGRAA